jgi:hypothetical protein
MADQRRNRPYSVTIYPQDGELPRVFAIADREGNGPRVADQLDAVLDDLLDSGLNPVDDIILYRNRAGIWDEVWVGRQRGFASIEPIDGEPRTVADALVALRKKWLPPWSPGDPGTYRVEDHGEVIAVCHEIPEKSGNNSAHQVIEGLKEQGEDLERRRVIFCDADGAWDELVVRGGVFVGSRGLHAEGLDEALERVRASGPANGAIVADSAWLGEAKEYLNSRSRIEAHEGESRDQKRSYGRGNDVDLDAFMNDEHAPGTLGHEVCRLIARYSDVVAAPDQKLRNLSAHEVESAGGDRQNPVAREIERLRAGYAANVAEQRSGPLRHVPTESLADLLDATMGSPIEAAAMRLVARDLREAAGPRESAWLDEARKLFAGVPRGTPDRNPAPEPGDGHDR